ncbi:MAG TPA: hypothetical protein VGN57_06860 [Pirellulaceae bacterium]|jgi:hypothetical protein|nr:hypothetical protein [Pirellulaceae bacterium]
MTRFLRARTMLFLGLAVAFATAAFAEIASRTPEQLQKAADVIVVGTVQEIHAQRTMDELWDDQVGTVLFLVEKVEKGDKVGPGDQMKIDFWTKRWVGPKGANMPTYGSGHFLPKADPQAKVRAFVQIKEDGSYHAILPNGFNELSPAGNAKK